MKKFNVKFEILGKNLQTEVLAETPFGAITAVKMKVEKSFAIHNTEVLEEAIGFDQEVDMITKQFANIFGVSEDVFKTEIKKAVNNEQ